MLVCSCNIIVEKDIVETIRSLLAEDEWRLITPVQVYHAMSKRGRCCGCFPNVVDIIVRTTEAWHREKATPEEAVVDFVGRLRDEHARMARERAAAQERMRKIRAA